MVKKLIRVAVTLVAGWFLYSVTGVVPMSMAFDLPNFMHFGKGALTESGYSDENALFAELDQLIVSPGTFDGMDLFSSGNIGADAWYDGEVDAYHLVVTPDTGDLEDDSAVQVYNNEGTVGDVQDCYTTVLYVEEMSNARFPTNHTGWLSLSIGDLEYLVGRNYAWPSVGGYNDTVAAVQDWKGQFGNEEKINMTRLAELLERQMTENITPRELVSLLQLCCSGNLLGWYPEEHTAIVRSYDGNTITVLHTDGGTWENYEYLPYKNILAISHMEIIGYDEGNGEIILHRFSDDMTVTLLNGVESLKRLNFKVEEDIFIIGGLLDSHTAFIYNCTDSKYSELPLGSDFDAKDLIFGERGFLIVSPEDDGSFLWKRGGY